MQDIFLTFTDTGDDYDGALNKLTEYFAPKKNIPFERHVFRQGRNQVSPLNPSLRDFERSLNLASLRT